MENNHLDNEQTVNEQDRYGSGIKPQKKNANKKLGIAIMLAGLLGVIVVASPHILSAFSSEEEPKQVEKETKTRTAYTPPVVEEPKEQKVFTFDDKEEEKPMEKIGEERIGETLSQTENAPPKLIKSITGDMMNKVGSGITSNQETGVSASEDYAQSDVERAIAQAERSLQNQSESEKIGSSSSNGDIFNAPIFKASVAKKSRYNPNLLLEQGTLIPCALRVRVISNVSGNISCTITENVYSSNGNVLLIDKGSRVNGYYQGGSVGHGSNQLFVVWQEVRTPDHLVIPLNSGSTDELGANGLNGWVDNHFWERFSNAIFLSMILDGNNILMSKLSKQQQTNTENTREAGKEIATTVLEQMGDIKPTLYKNQGDKVGIFVARDVDFSSVYQLKRSK